MQNDMFASELARDVHSLPIGENVGVCDPLARFFSVLFFGVRFFLFVIELDSWCT